MSALVLRGFLQRKLRVLLTAVAIALGVALMAGTYILTDTINHSFAAIFNEVGKKHDVVVTPAETLGRQTRSENSPVTEATLARVRAVPGVAKAAGSIFHQATLLDSQGKRLEADTLRASWAASCRLRSAPSRSQRGASRQAPKRSPSTRRPPNERICG